MTQNPSRKLPIVFVLLFPQVIRMLLVSVCGPNLTPKAKRSLKILTVTERYDILANYCIIAMNTTVPPNNFNLNISKLRLVSMRLRIQRYHLDSLLGSCFHGCFGIGLLGPRPYLTVRPMYKSVITQILRNFII